MAKNNETSEFGKIVSKIQAGDADNTKKMLDLTLANHTILRSMDMRIAELVQAWKGDPLKDAEARDENQDILEKIYGALSEKTKPATIEAEKKKSFSWWKLIIGAVAVMGAALLTFIQELAVKLSHLFPGLRKVFKVVGMFVNAIAGIATKFVGWLGEEGAIGKKWKSIKASLSVTRESLVLSYIRPLTDFLEELGFKRGAKAPKIGMFGKMFQAFKGFLNMLEPIFGPAIKLGQSIGKVMGKLIYPLTIAMSIWDTVTGAIDGWKSSLGESKFDRWVSAIAGGLGGLVGGLVGGLLDLGKSLLSWIVGFFSKDAEKFLDSFSFTQLIKDGFTVIAEGFKTLVDLFVAPFKGAKFLYDMLNGDVGAMETYEKFIKNILRGILPEPGEHWYSPGSLIGAVIPDSVYDYAGLSRDGDRAYDFGRVSKAEMIKAKAINPNFENANAENQARTLKLIRGGKDIGGMMAPAQNTVINNSTIINSSSSIPNYMTMGGYRPAF